MSPTRYAMRTILLPLVIALASCEAPPKGDSGDRVPIGTTTGGDTGRGQMTTPDLAQASDEAAQKFASDLTNMAQNDFRGKRVSIIFGDIENRSRTMPVSDFEYVRSRMRGKLMEPRFVTDNVKFVEGRVRIQRQNDEEYGTGGEDLLDEGKGGGVGVSRDNPNDTYYLNIDVDSVHRAPTHLFGVTFSLARAHDGEIVFNKFYEVKYAPSPAKRR